MLLKAKFLKEKNLLSNNCKYATSTLKTNKTEKLRDYNHEKFSVETKYHKLCD